LTSVKIGGGRCVRYCDPFPANLAPVNAGTGRKRLPRLACGPATFTFLPLSQGRANISIASCGVMDGLLERTMGMGKEPNYRDRGQDRLPKLQNDDTSLPIPLISVLQESLVRAKTHAQFIEQRIAAHEADSGRRTTRTALIHVARIELTIAEYDREAIALDNAIQVEEDRTGIQDPAHVAYPAAAKGKLSDVTI
jgi:hypothetical protein